ncbi:MAG TPA: M20/M25/M40 family metallo-hydrolase [Thermoanaerobaculia bacterium]
MTRKFATTALALLLFVSCRTATQSTTSEPALLYDVQPAIDAARALSERPDIERAFQFVESDRETIVADWTTINEIPAPSGHEAARALHIEALLRGSGLLVERDGAGNLIATRKGAGGGSTVVFDAHLDTVFALDTDVTTRIEGNRIHGPGVGDNTRNVVALLAMIRAMNAAAVETAGDIVFLFSVEEETTFRGIDHFLAERGDSIDRFVALDGGFGGFTYGGIGIHWDRYHIEGRGGHTLSGSPPWSATLPLARAITRIYELPLGDSARLNVGMLGAANVFNAKARDAWMSVDLRSVDGDELLRLDREVEAIVAGEASRLGMRMRRESIAKRTPAVLDGHRTSPMIVTAEGVWRAFGFNPSISNTASNHAAVVLRAGIPAISSGSGPCRNAHALDESCEIEPLLTGIRRNIVLAVALASDDPARVATDVAR